ncbi:MAG TPA: hypothetical protein VGQ72_05060 [Pyrinomonadaceae bacterium]|jgi:pimeloyl-ACP methyl ester carboxylesterase|nr:hypothetical protein [Pyrinomonadaceae bacterium]
MKVQVNNRIYSYRLMIAAVTFFAASSAFASGVHARFDWQTTNGAPFPSNVFTVADADQLTSLRVNLPRPDCSVQPSDCSDLDIINDLDGFNLLARLTIPFDAAIDLTSVTGGAIFIVKLDDGERHRIGINRIVWDPLTNTLYAEAGELLEQHTRYALIVTNGVRDAAGAPVEPSEEFLRFRHDMNFGQTNHESALKEYRKSLLDAFVAAREVGVGENDVVAASVFTTQTATAMLEKIRDQIKAGTPAPADFNLGAGGDRTVFALSNVSRVDFNQQMRTTAVPLVTVPLSLNLLKIIPGVVGQIAFGKYASPDYLVHPGEYIPQVATRSGDPQVQRTSDIYFNLFLPSGTPPANGWPIAIFGVGSANNKNNQPLEVAAKMAKHGIATISINFYGNGLGPLSTLTVTPTTSSPVSLSAGGRSLDQNLDTFINEGEGRSAAAPRTLISSRDAAIQTIADFMQLVRVIQVGMDVDGDGVRDLDPQRISYFGHSLGGMWGTIFTAVEPDVQVAAFNSVGTPYDNLRLSPRFRTASIGMPLSLRTPSLINSPGLIQIGGIGLTPGPTFNENLPLRDQPPVINNVSGALEIQEFLDHMKWATQSASSLAFAPYLRKQPLAGMPPKSVLFQFNLGDYVATNPTTTAILRAGDLADRATLYRNDLAKADNPAVVSDPHLLIRGITTPAVAPMAFGVQEQIAVFLASNGITIIHPDPMRFFEVPVAMPLPETLNFIP